MASEDLLFKLGVDANGISRGLTGVRAQVSSFTGEVLGNFAKAFSFVAGIEAVRQMGAKMAALRREAEELGVSTTFMQAFGKLAEKFGGIAEDAASAFGKLNIKIGEAADSTSGAAKAFNKWGITLADAQGNMLNTEDVMRAIMQKYHDLPDAASKAAFAFEIFGRSGKNVAAVLNLGNEEFDKLTKKMEDSGKILKAQEVKTYADAWLAVKDVFAGMASPFVTLTEKIVRGWTIISRTLDNMRFKGQGASQAMTEAYLSTLPNNGKPEVKIKADTTQAQEALAKLRQTMVEEFDKLSAAIGETMKAYAAAANGVRLSGMSIGEARQRENVMNSPEGSQQRIQQQTILNALVAQREAKEMAFLQAQHQATKEEMRRLGEQFHQSGDRNEREKIKLDMTKKGVELAKQEEEINRRGAQNIKDQGDRQREMNALIANRAALQAASVNADRALADAKTARTKYTLEELATGNPRGVADTKLREEMIRAQEAFRLERRAMYGKNVLGESEETIQGFLDKAQGIKAGLTRLNEGERSPFKSLEESSQAAAKILKDIRDNQDKPPKAG
ncbi:MAG: hypothetical protein EBS84_20845 [Proteobacteria bacterium]|nr:hypothetical protein [Pseudomonadota bacterium]